MLSSNKPELEHCNVLSYHAANILGQGVTIAVLDEMPFLRECCQDKDFVAPLGVGKEASHGSNVCQVIWQVAPKVRVIGLPFIQCGSELQEQSIAWLEQHKAEVDLVNISGSFAHNEKWQLWQRLQKLGIPVVAAGGNGGEEELDKPAAFEWTIGVGAWEEGRDSLAGYSNAGNLDCVGYTNVAILNSKGQEMSFNGTSCAAPFVAGMLALCLQQMGVKQTVWQLKDFIKEHCRDVKKEGYDRESGYGLFVLPDLSDLEAEKMEIRMTIGSKVAEVNGEIKTLSLAPVEKQGTTLVPIRFVAEALGCEVEYEAVSRGIVIKK